MTTHPTMTPTFESANAVFSPGVNSRVELVTLDPGLRPERRLARGSLFPKLEIHACSNPSPY